ncbi:MAG: hypothetical protein RIR45_1564 [Pseudomonadota bacterium]|jgi:mannose-6-phosphate isomerase
MQRNTEAIGTWMEHTIVPMWRDKGRDTRTGLTFESLTRTWEPTPALQHRAMVAARQAFFFFRVHTLFDQPSQALPLAEAQMALLAEVFADRQNGGWVYAVDHAGQPLDTAKDLYTTAFVLLAAAEACTTTGNTRYLALAEAVLVVLERHFLDPATGLYHSRLDQNHASVLLGPDQNSHMHLFEAVGHLCRTSDTPAHRALLQHIMDSVQRHFYDPQRAAILELPLACAENRIEPGHQFEWYFLIHHNAQFLARSAPALALADAIFAQANQRGIDVASMRVLLALHTDFSVKDGSFRIWTQLEWIRALAVRAAQASGSNTDVLDQAVASFCAHFMAADGWHEWLSGTGPAVTLLRADLPASTPYHLIGCWEALRDINRCLGN